MQLAMMQNMAGVQELYKAHANDIMQTIKVNIHVCIH